MPVYVGARRAVANVVDSGPSLYLGPATTRFGVHNARNASLRLFNATKGAFIRGTILGGVRLALAPWSVDINASGQEVFYAGTTTYRAQLEYPVGVFTRFTWGGNTNGIATDGVAEFVSDMLPIALPDGAFVKVWVNGVATAGIYYNTGVNAQLNAFMGDTFEYATSGLTDKSDGTPFTSTGVASYRPLHLLGTKRDGTVALIGDSRVQGLGDTADASGDLGELARSIGQNLAYCDLGVSSDRAMWQKSNFARRLVAVRRCTSGVIQPAINDLANGQSGAQVVADQDTLRALAPEIPMYVCTSPASLLTRQ